jgi:hypothetical protein
MLIPLKLAAVAAVGALAPPAGFVARADLAKRMTPLVGKPVAVYCSGDQGSWNDLYEGVDRADGLGSVDRIGGDTAYLHSQVCAALTLQLRKKAVSTPALADALLTFSHQAQHLHETLDEHDAECAALVAVPALARAFGVKAGKVTAVTRAARTARLAKTTPYAGSCA